MINLKLKKFIPQRTTIAFVIIPFFSIILFIFLQKVYFEENNSNIKSTQELVEKIELETSLDTDGDGLLDWEERLYKTDVNLEDTDGDGLSDAFEVTTNTDPLDFLNLKSKERAWAMEQERKSLEEDKIRELNATEKMMQEILIRTAQLHHSGLIHNDSALNQVAGIILDKTELNFKNKYTIEDLNISDTLSIEDFQDSFIKINKELDDFMKSFYIQLELDILLSYFKSQNETILERLDKNIEFQNLVISKSKELEIPEEMAGEYINYINLLQVIVDILEVFRNADEDPVAAISAISIYRQIIEDTDKSAMKLLLYFKE